MCKVEVIYEAAIRGRYYEQGRCGCVTTADTVEEALLKIAFHVGWGHLFEDYFDEDEDTEDYTKLDITEEEVIAVLEELGMDDDEGDFIITATNLDTGTVYIDHTDVEFVTYEEI